MSTSFQLLNMSVHASCKQTSTFQSKNTTGVRPHRLQCQATAGGRAAGAELAPQQADRRAVLGMLGLPPILATAACLTWPALAEEGPAATAQLVQYSDEPDEFELSVPEGWTAGEGQAAGAKFGGASGARRALAWYPESDISTNVSLIITNVGPDFTKLGSFGTPLGFGENLVASMDRKFMKKSSKEPVQEARLLATKEASSNGHQLYLVDYGLKKPGEDEERIFLTAVCLGFNGRYNRLYTLTAQSMASTFSGNESMLRSVLSSFKPPAPVV